MSQKATETPTQEVVQQPNTEQQPEKGFKVSDAYPQPAHLKLDQDPNHALSVMIGRRKAKQAEKKPEATEEKAEKPKENADGNKKLGDLIANHLKFTRGTEEKKTEPEKQEEPKKEEAQKKEKEETTPAATEEKTKVTTKKRGQDTQDPDKTVHDTSRLVKEVAESTAQAVASAIAPKVDPNKPQKDADASIEDSLKAGDLREYQIAKHLAATNPKYAGAEKIILDQIKKTEAYASKWESENPGKVFDPKDSEHDTFYSGLKTPWTEEEFRDAEMDYRAELKFAQKNEETNRKLKEIELNAAKSEIVPEVNKAFTNAAGSLAKAIGDDVISTITKEGFQKLEEKDPITAEVLTETLGPLRPIIETIIQLDDPKGRFDFDKSNPLHQKWVDILVEGEKRCAGMKDEAGRMFATRSEYRNMTPAQRQRHWFLTADHMVHGVVEFAAETAKRIISDEKKRIEKIAKAQGWSLTPQQQQQHQESQVTKQQETKPEEKPAAQAIKPQSPSAGGGAPIDGTGTVTGGKHGQVLSVISKALGMK